MTPPLSRPNRFEVDLGAVAHNARALRRLVGPAVQVYAALKADAYGFGLLEVAGVVLAEGADALAVADLAEAVRLRQHGVRAPILLYAGSMPEPAVVEAVERHALLPTLLDDAAAQAYSRHARGPIRAFVKVDVGLERLGVPPEEALGFVRRLRALPRLELAGLYTHLHVPAGEHAAGYVGWQFRHFQRVVAALEAEGIAVPVRMAAASAGLRLAPAMALNAVDPGHLLYGLIPAGPNSVSLELRPAFHRLASRLIQVRPVTRTEFLDQAPVPIRPGMRLGVIPLGAADGLASLHCGQVLVHGRRAPLLGRPSLEHTRLDLTAVPEAAVGDEVVVIGRQGEAEITPAEVVAHQGIAAYHLALAVRASVPRVHLPGQAD